jgi:hypothetical protein
MKSTGMCVIKRRKNRLFDGKINRNVRTGERGRHARSILNLRSMPTSTLPCQIAYTIFTYMRIVVCAS